MSDDLPEVVYFHEDDYCQQEVLPLSAMPFCLRQIGEITKFSDEHRSPDGLGWTDIYMRGESCAKLSSMGISLEALRQVFIPTARETSTVFTGYADYKERSPNTHCFSWGDCRVFTQFDEREAAVAIWSTFFAGGMDLQQASECLDQLGTRLPLLYVDWAWGFAVPIDGQGELLKRLVAKNQAIAERLS